MTKKVFPGRVLFDHLQKTAGQAINKWLSESLGSGCVSPNLIGHHLELIRQFGGLYSVISAHVRFSENDQLDPRYQYMTIFREPIDRAISWVFFVVNDVPADPGTVLLKEGARRFIETDGRDSTPEFLESITNPYVKHFECLCKRAREDGVSRALAVVQQYDVVGIYEEMPRFVLDVAGLIGLPVPEALPRFNVTRKRLTVGEVSPAVRQRIQELNQLDLRLYDQVVSWKASLRQDDLSSRCEVIKPRWEKHEPVRDRSFVASEVVVGDAVLREGYHIAHGQMMTFDVELLLVCEIQDLEMGVHIFDIDRRWAFGTNSSFLGQSHQSVPSGSYRVSYHLVADLPEGKYTAGFAFAEKLPEGSRELAWFDVRCEFVVLRQVGKSFAGYTYLPAQISLCRTGLALAEAVVSAPAGGLVAEGPDLSMAAGESTWIGVTVLNRGEQAWLGDTFRPINLSYHWLGDSGEAQILEGVRTPIPEGGVGPGQTVSTDLLVKAPDQAGSYVLVLTLVQENVMWFEEDERFEPARLTVEVTAPNE